MAEGGFQFPFFTKPSENYSVDAVSSGSVRFLFPRAKNKIPKFQAMKFDMEN